MATVVTSSEMAARSRRFSESLEAEWPNDKFADHVLASDRSHIPSWTVNYIWLKTSGNPSTDPPAHKQVPGSPVFLLLMYGGSSFIRTPRQVMGEVMALYMCRTLSSYMLRDISLDWLGGHARAHWRAPSWRTMDNVNISTCTSNSARTYMHADLIF